MRTCLLTNCSIDSSDQQIRARHEMSPASTSLQKRRLRVNLVVLILMVAMCWPQDTVSARAVRMRHSDTPTIFIECDEYEHDSYGAMKRSASDKNRLLSELEDLYRANVHVATATPRPYLDVQSYKQKYNRLRDRNRILREKVRKYKKARNTLKGKLSRTRARLKQMRELLLNLSTGKTSAATVAAENLHHSIIKNHHNKNNNMTMAWHCKFHPRDKTTRGYPEIIQTGTCSPSNCMNDLFMCAEQHHWIPILKSTSDCMNYPLRTTNKSIAVKKVKFYGFRWIKVVSGCQCVLKPNM